MKRAILGLACRSFHRRRRAHAQGTLRIGMTASDIPLTTGQTDQGGEGMRFMGYTVYDALINWDLSSADKPSDSSRAWRRAGRSTSRRDKTKWIFKLREGVKFHDGSEFTAEAVVWNLDKILKKDAPQFDPRQSAQGARASRRSPATRRSTSTRSRSPPRRPTRRCPTRSPGS